jgi:1,4-dihydroxy-2-naphthoate octaprenyltransferase
MHIIKLWLRAVRAPFFTGIIIPIIFGAVLAFDETGHIYWGLFIVSLLGGLFAHAGANLANDYYDHRTTDDDINPNYGPFSGGSRMIQSGFLSARAVISGALTCWGLALAAGLYLTFKTPGYWVLWLAAAGFVGGFFYTATKYAFAYNGLGELAILANFGILPVLGAYYVQAGHFSWTAFWASFPIGFLITAILYINQFPDYEADRKVRKNHLVVSLGQKKARIGYYFLIFGNYSILLLAVGFAGLTPYTLVALLSLPLAIRTVRIFSREYNKIKELIPAQAGTVQVHLLTGLLMSGGCLLAALL